MCTIKQLLCRHRFSVIELLSRQRFIECYKCGRQRDFKLHKWTANDLNQSEGATK